MNETAIDRLFLEYSIKRLEEHASRIEACLGRLSDDQVWARGQENENAIANLILHLCGNVRQWIIAGIGGAGDQRQRDLEFSARQGDSKAQLAARMRATVDEAVAVIRKVPAAVLAERRTIQGYDVAVLEAIYQVVEHFSGHTGQIIFATKMLTGADLGFYRYLQFSRASNVPPAGA
ncbi:MAG TPA: DinB family protein [Bryobacteraceae bacterium]|nr:DinB family protein [Bryobacteraceae bacterium]